MRRIRFKTLTISNFKSYTAEQVFDFDQPPGLVLVSGENRVDARLTGNGAGKSSLFGALCFALYGKDAAGTRGPDLRNWDKKGTTEVTLKLSVNKVDHTIERKLAPNLLLLDGTEVPQEEVDQLIGIEYQIFNVVVLHGQNMAAFLDFPAPVQLEYFSNLLSLETYMTAGKIAVERARKLEGEAKELEKQYFFDRGFMVEIDNRLDGLRDQDVKWCRERYRTLLRLQKEIKEAKAGLAKEIEKQKPIEPFDMKYYDAAERMLRKDKKARDDIMDKLEQLDRDIARVQKSMPDAGVCKACGQALPDAVKTKKNLLDKLLDLRAEVAEEEKTLERVKQSYVASKLNMEKQIKRLDEYKATHGAEVAKREKAVATLESNIQALEQDMENWRDVKVSEYASGIKMLENRLQGLKESTAQQKESIDTLYLMSGLCRYWDKGFKELRLQLIDDALAQMAFKSNSALHDLGLPDWQVNIQAESINKSGTVKRGMKILAGKDELKSIHCFSGGETQRLRLAVALGFSDLVEALCGVTVNIELFDEPSSWLSQQGVTDLLDVLSERAMLQNKRIYIADHRSLEYPFAAQVVVVKTEDGSVLEVE